MSGQTDLPDWVWQLVAGLGYYEDVHPPLYRMTDDVKYERTDCPSYLLRVVPLEVRETCDVLTSYNAIDIPALAGDSDA